MPEVAELTGRQLDAAVAERVMGWWNADTEHKRWAWYTGDDEKFEAELQALALWSPSTNIAAAWQVVEKLTGQGFEFMFIYTEADLPNMDGSDDFLPAKGSHAGFRKPEHKGDYLLEQAPSAPEAICRAALKAVGE